MSELYASAGNFIYPLGCCSFLALFILLERLWALRMSAIVPTHLLENLKNGRIEELSGQTSVAARILQFWSEQSPSPDALKAVAELEIKKLERGMFILDVVVGIAPLLGLLGTVTGLQQVFSGINPGESMPDTGIFVEGIALALTTTMMGLAIAIPAMVGNSFLMRRVDLVDSRLHILVEHLIELSMVADNADFQLDNDSASE